MPSAAIRKAFAAFDTDGSGTLTAEECLAILTRGASDEEQEMMGMSVDDAQEIIDDFDKNGDGVLSIDEFAEAFDMFMLDEDDFGGDAGGGGGNDGDDEDAPEEPPAPKPAAAAAPPSGGGGGGGGEAVEYPPYVYSGMPASGPGFAMFSPESHACCSVKVMGKTYEKDFVGDRQGPSRQVCDMWSMNNSSNQVMIKYKVDDTKYDDTPDKGVADGASITVPEDGGFLDLTLVTHLPLSAPIYNLKSAKPKGPVVIGCETYIVDLYVEVDGVARQDGHICFGDASMSNEEALQRAEQSTEPIVGKSLKDGPPGNVRPFASLVSRDFRNDHFVHLPLIATDVDSACMKESQAYGPHLLKHFMALLGQVGEGTHKWSVRCQPRGIVAVTPDLCVSVTGQVHNSCGVNAEGYMQKDPKFAKLIEELAGQAHPAFAHPGFRASFNMTVPAKFCSGGGPERFAEEFNPNFSKDVEEYCGYALQIAPTGASGAAARKVLGSKLGPVAHITIAGFDLAGGWTPLGGDGTEKSGEKFVPWAYWYNPDDDGDDAEGVMVKFWAIRYDRKDYRNVDNPDKWHSEDLGMFRCTGLKIKNKNIKAAIARDSHLYSV